MEEQAKKRVRKGDLAPNAELWEALRQGEGLSEILNDFYDIVYDDPKMAPFFEGFTKKRAIEKQYSFMMQIFTGERVYFGERPRNAHHWMVISDELFDYREEMMEGSLRRYGLSDELIQKWRAAEEVFRKQIVKSEAWPKKIGGKLMPLEGYETLTLDFGSLCDSCEAAMDEGTTVRYHVRTGKTYCPACSPNM